MILLAISLLVTGAAANAVDRPQQTDRDGKLFSVFQIVRFQNGECTGTSGNLGSCYTEAECTAQGGTADGNCASGFGVCCVATLGSGTANKCQNKDFLVKLNNTLIESPGFPSTVVDSGCISNTRSLYRQDTPAAAAAPLPYLYDIQKKTADIQQIRLEFLTFEIDSASAGSCSNATISVTGVDATSSAMLPTNLCGMNTGQSIYLSVKNTPVLGNVTVKIQLGGYGTQKWRIRVQYLDSADDLAPRGCLQYFREPMGSVMSFNSGVELLTDHEYTICFKEMTDMCSIQFTSSTFDLSGTSGSCTATDPKVVIGANTYCGSTFGTVTTMASVVSVVTGMTNAAMNKGFELTYMMLPCTK